MKQLIIPDMGKFIILVSIILLAGCLNTFSQLIAWQVPAEMANKTNPLSIEPKNVAMGRNIFSRSCVACHGAKADGQGLIKSASLIAKEFQKQADGTIFYKITTGRDKMPPFKATLKDDEIWAVINYLRVLINPSAIPPAKNVKLEISTGDEIKSVTAFVYSADSAKLPLQEVDVHFYVKRDFGLMSIGELSNYTGTDGKVKVIFPDNIIGDAEGYVSLLVKVENDFLYNNAESEVIRQWGEPMIMEDKYFNQRSLWGSRNKSPIWLLLLANGIIAAVWGAIFYVAYNLFRIKKAGKIFTK